jgi:hypothetical protein
MSNHSTRVSLPVLLASAALLVGCTVDATGDEEDLGDAGDALVSILRTPDVAIQIRTLNDDEDDDDPNPFGCLDATAASDAAAEIERQFRENVSSTAFARVICGVPSGGPAGLRATTIGVWTGGSTLFNVTASLSQLNLVETSFSEMATWASRRFMKAQVAANAGDTAEFDVQSTNVTNLTNPYFLPPLDWTRTTVEGETLGTLIAWDVTVTWDETMEPRTSAQTTPSSPSATHCPAVPSGFTTNTNRIISRDNEELEAGFPARGVVGQLVDKGLFPSRLLVRPADDTVDPIADGVLHLDYANFGDVEVVFSGILDGIVVRAALATTLLEDRAPCARIAADPPLSTVHPFYEASTFDLRPPLTFQWTGSGNLNISTPNRSGTYVTFDDAAMGRLDLRVTDADGVVRTRTRFISTTSP